MYVDHTDKVNNFFSFQVFQSIDSFHHQISFYQRIQVYIRCLNVLVRSQFCVLNTMEKNQKEMELTKGLLSSPRESDSTLSEERVTITPPKKMKRGILSKYRKVEPENSMLKDEAPQQEKEKSEQKEEKIKDKDKRKFSWPIWKKLFGYTLKRKFHLILGLVLNIAFAMSISTLPLKIGTVLDKITTTSSADTEKNVDDLKTSVFELGIMTLLLAIFTFTRFLSTQFLQQFLAIDMKNDFFRKFIQNDMYFFEKYKSGELVSRLSSDVNQAKSAVSNNITYLIRSIVIIVGNFIILFTISLELTSMIILLVPLYCFLTVHYSRRKKVLVREKQDVQAEISAAVTEKFSGIQLVKAYSTEQHEISLYGEIIMRGYDISKKRIILTAIYNSFSEFLPYIGIMTVLWYGGSEVIKGSTVLTAGQLTSFILYCTILANSTSAIANSYTNIINGTYAVQKVFQMLDYTPLIDESKGEKHDISGDIEFRNVTFQYPTSSTISLNNISFKIDQGEYIAFVGQSGSGKSTIIKLIEKFYHIESGKIYYGPHQQSDINATHLRKQIGLVNQDATIFSGTIEGNISYGLEGYTLEDMEEAAERAGCMQFLNNQKRFPDKFQSEVGEKGNNLSGGQKQRISIARALMRKPKIIIFDQATSALDSNSESMVQQSIQNIAKINRIDKPTIIVIAHRLSTVMNANRIFVMKNGEILQTGSHRNLLQQRGYYYQLIEKQLGDSPKLQLSPESKKSEQQPNKF